MGQLVYGTVVQYHCGCYGEKDHCTLLKQTLSISASSFSLSSCSSRILARSSEFSFVSRSCALSFDRISSSDYNKTTRHVLAYISRSCTLPHQCNPCSDCKSAQQCTTRGHPLPLLQVTSGSMQQCGHAAADGRTDRDRQTDRQTDERDHNTFRVVCNSRRM